MLYILNISLVDLVVRDGLRCKLLEDVSTVNMLVCTDSCTVGDTHKLDKKLFKKLCFHHLTDINNICTIIIMTIIIGSTGICRLNMIH